MPLLPFLIHDHSLISDKNCSETSNLCIYLSHLPSSLKQNKISLLFKRINCQRSCLRPALALIFWFQVLFSLHGTAPTDQRYSIERSVYLSEYWNNGSQGIGITPGFEFPSVAVIQHSGQEQPGEEACVWLTLQVPSSSLMEVSRNSKQNSGEKDHRRTLAGPLTCFSI